MAENTKTNAQEFEKAQRSANDAVKDTFATLQLDMLAVKGKKEAVSIFCLLGDPSFKNSVDFKKLEKKHKNVMLL